MEKARYKVQRSSITCRKWKCRHDKLEICHESASLILTTVIFPVAIIVQCDDKILKSNKNNDAAASVRSRYNLRLALTCASDNSMKLGT